MISSSTRSLSALAPGDRWSARHWAMLVVLGCALLLDALDVSMVGVAVPSIRRDLSLSTSSLQWVVSGYVLGYGGLLLLGGRAADLLGRRRVLLVALAECCLGGGIGVRGAALHPEGDIRLDAMFFGESQSRFVVSTHSRALPELQSVARRAKVDLMLIGLTGGDRIELTGQVDVSLAELRTAWEGGLERAVAAEPVAAEEVRA